ncbi:MAG: hypothetical protein RLZZ393_302 [Pseudomonadota bacterium]
MRRALVILVLIGLVAVSAIVAVVAADWPFWQRAWRWHAAPAAGPEHIPGAWHWIGAGSGTPWASPDQAGTEAVSIDALVRQVPTRALVASRHGRLVAEVYGEDSSADQLLQGGALSGAILAPLYGVARAGGLDLLDQPLRRLSPALGEDPRGEITPRQLLWQVSGLGAPSWRPLDPFNPRSRLFAGPDFDRAARGFPVHWPPGSHFETSPANLQLAAGALVSVGGISLAQWLETGLWGPIGAGRARVALDRLGGGMAAHCCMAATARDWLRLAQLYGSDGIVAGRRLWPAGFVSREIARVTAVHPAYGLGVEIETLGDGSLLLWSGDAHRTMLAVPARGLAAVWFTRGSAGSGERMLLKAALGLDVDEANP